MNAVSKSRSCDKRQARQKGPTCVKSADGGPKTFPQREDGEGGTGIGDLWQERKNEKSEIARRKEGKRPL